MRATPADTPRRRRRRAIVVGATCCGLAIAACGSSRGTPGVAGIAGATTRSTSAAPSRSLVAALRFSSCMRSHGVPSFPDPAASGAPARVGRGDKDSPAFQGASQACRSLEGGLAAAKPVTKVARQLSYAGCMRAHGVAGFPDPLPSGGFEVPSTVDTQSPTFTAANRACRST